MLQKHEQPYKKKPEKNMHLTLEENRTKNKKGNPCT